MTLDLLIIRYGQNKAHAVDAGGSAEDGSLYGFYTLCGLRIDDDNTDNAKWHEEKGARLECKNCIRFLHWASMKEQPKRRHSTNHDTVLRTKDPVEGRRHIYPSRV